jgi:hypothetical protein
MTPAARPAVASGPCGHDRLADRDGPTAGPAIGGRGSRRRSGLDPTLRSQRTAEKPSRRGHQGERDQVSAAHRIKLDNEPSADAVKAMQAWRARALARCRPGLWPARASDCGPRPEPEPARRGADFGSRIPIVEIDFPAVLNRAKDFLIAPRRPPQQFRILVALQPAIEPTPATSCMIAARRG